jgi:hypothetical protein
MGAVVTPSQLDGLFYEIYADNYVEAVPDVAKFIKLVPFSPADKEMGKSYNQPVVLTNEAGFTYAAAGSGAFNLNSSIAFTMKNATIQGSQIVLRSTVSYDSAAKASNSKKAFVKELDLQIKNMIFSTKKRLEIAYFYGGAGLGKTASYTNVSATQAVITLTAATYATGIWAGSQDCAINFYNGATLISSGADAVFTIFTTSPAANTLTVNGTATGITALGAAINSPATLDIFYQGAYGQEMVGIDQIITRSGTVFGIDNSVYNLWKGNTSSASSADLTMGKVLNGLALPVAQGLDEPVALFVSPATWARLNADLAALRRYDSSYKAGMGENGVEAIEYNSQNGKISIYSHSIIKPSEGFAFPLKRCKRLGAMDLTFKSFVNGQQMFRELQDQAGFELRNYTDQCVMFDFPARCVKFTNIVNS